MDSAPIARLAALATLCFVLLAAPARAQTFVDPAFTAETIATLPAYQPVGIAFAPDGQIFVWQENGLIRVIKAGALLPEPFLDLRGKVNTVNDRGLLGLALDPGFAANGFVYLFYVHEGGGNPEDTGPKTARLTRVTADPANPDVALPGSEQILLGSVASAPCSQHPAGSDCIGAEDDSHSVGTLLFAPDGTLFASMGDGASYLETDAKALRAQDLDSYNGKILRINPDGSAPSDNPFFDPAASIRSRVYAYGLRNPYRFGLTPGSGEPVIGDVGWNHWEEINRGRGKNFGWPCFEGAERQPGYQVFATCQALPTDAVTPPLHTYSHDVGRAAIGGAFYVGEQYPAAYRGNFFFADYDGGWIKRGLFDEDGTFTGIAEFATNAGGVVSIALGPDGNLYYIEIASGHVRRIRYSQPQAVASATPRSGPSPLVVTFSSAGSRAPDAGALTYAWAFGDGATSTDPNPTHTYVVSGAQTFEATLTVTDAAGRVASTSLPITIGSTPPIALITAPADGFVALPGEMVTVVGTATDGEESLGAGALSWQVLLHHNDHVHPYTTGTGPSISFQPEEHGEGTFSYEIVLTATDSTGLVGTARIRSREVGRAVHRINAGGGSFVDPQGQTWSADAHFNTGATAATGQPIEGTTLDPLYQSERWDPPGAPELRYSLPVNPGSYEVRLHFADIYSGTAAPGQRVFDVAIEGAPALTAFDIAAEVGPRVALIKRFVVDVSDGTLDIDFAHGAAENPKISAIEVLTANPLPTRYRINTGGPAYDAPDGRRFSADMGFNTGNLGLAGEQEVAGTDLDPLYWNER